MLNALLKTSNLSCANKFCNEYDFYLEYNSFTIWKNTITLEHKTYTNCVDGILSCMLVTLTNWLHEKQCDIGKQFRITECRFQETGVFDANTITIFFHNIHK